MIQMNAFWFTLLLLATAALGALLYAHVQHVKEQRRKKEEREINARNRDFNHINQRIDDVRLELIKEIEVGINKLHRYVDESCDECIKLNTLVGDHLDEHIKTSEHRLAAQGTAIIEIHGAIETIEAHLWPETTSASPSSPSTSPTPDSKSSSSSEQKDT